MDYLTIEANEGGKDVHILVITDHFNQYAQAFCDKFTDSQVYSPKSVGQIYCSTMGSLRKF